jgi:hypothetical protein
VKVSCHSQTQREEKTVSLIAAVPGTLESDSPLLEDKKKREREGKSKTKITETTISATFLKTHWLLSHPPTNYLQHTSICTYVSIVYIDREVNAKMDRILNHRHRRQTGILIQIA